MPGARQARARIPSWLATRLPVALEKDLVLATMQCQPEGLPQRERDR